MRWGSPTKRTIPARRRERERAARAARARRPPPQRRAERPRGSRPCWQCSYSGGDEEERDFGQVSSPNQESDVILLRHWMAQRGTPLSDSAATNRGAAMVTILLAWMPMLRSLGALVLFVLAFSWPRLASADILPPDERACDGRFNQSCRVEPFIQQGLCVDATCERYSPDTGPPRPPVACIRCMRCFDCVDAGADAGIDGAVSCARCAEVWPDAGSPTGPIESDGGGCSAPGRLAGGAGVALIPLFVVTLLRLRRRS